MVTNLPTGIRRLRCTGDGGVTIEEATLPVRGHGELLVRIETSAVCGSERRALLEGHPSNTGHEATGRVLLADPGSPFAPGTRVGLNAVRSCGQCTECIRGVETRCQLGTSGFGGWHASHAVVPERNARSLDEGIDSTTAALMTGDPLGVPVRALRRAPNPDGEVVVVGLGPVGLSHVLVRAHTGARVVALGRSGYRRELAGRLGASVVEDLSEFQGRAPLVIECTGRPDVAAKALDFVANGGTYFQSGECKAPIAVSLAELLIHREIQLLGSWYYASEDYPTMERLVREGLPVSRLVTHDVSAEEAQPAIADFLRGEAGKVLFRW